MEIGNLLIPHPKRRDLRLCGGVILIVDRGEDYTIGLQINKPFETSISFATVMENVGLSIDEDRPLYNGGITSQNRIHVVHSLDWESSNTLKLTNDIGVTNELSILSAISKGQGPLHYRVIGGCVHWTKGQLESEQSNSDISWSWNVVKSTIENVFLYDGIEQWTLLTEECIKTYVNEWF